MPLSSNFSIVLVVCSLMMTGFKAIVIARLITKSTMRGTTQLGCFLTALNVVVGERNTPTSRFAKPMFSLLAVSISLAIFYLRVKNFTEKTQVQRRMSSLKVSQYCMRTGQQNFCNITNFLNNASQKSAIWIIGGPVAWRVKMVKVKMIKSESCHYWEPDCKSGSQYSFILTF